MCANSTSDVIYPCLQLNIGINTSNSVHSLHHVTTSDLNLSFKYDYLPLAVFRPPSVLCRFAYECYYCNADLEKRYLIT